MKIRIKSKKGELSIGYDKFWFDGYNNWLDLNSNMNYLVYRNSKKRHMFRRVPSLLRGVG